MVRIIPGGCVTTTRKVHDGSATEVGIKVVLKRSFVQGNVYLKELASLPSLMGSWHYQK